MELVRADGLGKAIAKVTKNNPPGDFAAEPAALRSG